jgi:hypothetical protein
MTEVNVDSVGSARLVEQVAALNEALDSLRPMQRRVFDLVSKCRGMKFPDLADAIYADREDGGPDGAEMCVRTAAYQANAELRKAGIRIVSVPFLRIVSVPK